jgi:tetratricopeptide (TPR) repeat protein
MHLHHLAFLSVLLLCVPVLLPAEGKEKPAKGGKTAKKPDETKKPDEEGKTGAKKENDASAGSSANLEIPADLPPDVRKAMEDAVSAFKVLEDDSDEEPDSQVLARLIGKFKAVEKKAPSLPLPLYYLGIVYQHKKNYPEAKKVLEKAVKLNPRFHEAFVELADVYCWQKDWKGALPIYDQASGIEPTYLLALERKAQACIAIDMLADAKDHLLKAEKLNPDPGRMKFVEALDQEIKGPNWSKTFTAEKENYIVMTPVSQEFAEEMANHAELIRRAYDKVFSDIPKPDRKFRIFIFSDREQYMSAGNPPEALGYYSPTFRKLVLYKNSPKKDTLETLYHEAFHQYLHDYQEAAPQWFNEGLGEYFGAFEYSREGKKELMRSRPNAGRLNNVQFFIREKVCTPASELMRMSQGEMYDPQKIAVHYAQSWAMIYFCIEGKKPQYKATLVNYFRALQKGLDLKDAYAVTFGKLDMERFEGEWKGFIMGLAQTER